MDSFKLRDEAHQKNVKQFTEAYEKNKEAYIKDQESRLQNVKNQAELQKHRNNFSNNYDSKHKPDLEKKISISENFHFKDVGGTREAALQRTKAYEKQINGELPELSKEMNKAVEKEETEKEYDQRMKARLANKRDRNKDRKRED